MSGSTEKIDNAEEKGLIAQNIKESMVENPSEFHYSEPTFTRNLLKKSKESFILSPANGRKVSNEMEKKPFMDESGAGSSEDDQKFIDAPEDRFNFCYIIMYILGFGTLLPWNFFITANAYFGKKLETKPEFKLSFQNYFSVAAMVPNVAMMLLNTFFLQRFNRVYRMGIALVLMLALFIFTTVLVLLPTEKWTTEFFAVTISSMVFINMCSAVLQGGLFGFAGMLPPKYTQAVMGGQGLSGLFAAVASILSLMGQNNIYKSAFGYFLTASCVLVICLIALFTVFRLKFVKHYTTEKKYKCTCKCDSKMHDHLPNFVNEDAFDQVNIIKPAAKEKREKSQYFFVLKKIFPMLFSVIMVFLVTLACFPALTARIKSSNEKKSDWTEKYFVSVTCFLLFNLGDYSGRSIAGFVQIPRKTWPKWILPVISVSRFVFFPLFLFCKVKADSVPVFNHDAFPIIFMLLFAMSCGYFGSLAMMFGASAVEGKQAELAGTIMATGLSIGLGLGSATSFLATYFI